jgi:hypothetical protein
MASFSVPFGGGFLDTSVFLSNDIRTLGIINYIDTIAGDPSVATSSVAQTQTLPAGVIVLAASYTVTAKPAGFVTIGSVAQVRDAKGNALVVDFQGMRTVDRLRAPVAISQIKPWAGTKFSDDSEVHDGSFTEQSFTEIQTERLLVQFTGTIGADDLAANGSATVLSPPADLELLVNGTRAWFNAGPAKPGGSATDPAAFETTVDLTDAIRAAVAAAPPGTADIAVDVELRSSVPGQLALGASLELQRTFVVQFPEGDTRVIDAASEGVYEVLLPLPPESATWQVHEVQAAVSGTPGPPRVLPPDGPEISGDAELVLDADHAVLVGLPPADLAPLAVLSAIRLPLGVGADGAELAGLLRADADGLPGEPVKDGKLGPLTLPAGDLAERAWTTLSLAKEHKLAAGERLWVGLQLARGQVSWPLALPAPPAALSADAPLRRQLPNGAFRSLSAAGDVSTSAGALRVVGEAPNGSPIAALELEVTATEVGVPPFTPTSDGVPVALRLDPALTRANAPDAFDATGALKLRLTTKTPGSISFTGVRIAYTDGDGS